MDYKILLQTKLLFSFLISHGHGAYDDKYQYMNI
jgi:hypothetical protein